VNGNRVGVAFIGAGIVAEMHGRGVAANPGAELIGAYDPDHSRSAALTAKFGGAPFESLDAVLADPRVHAIHVLNPTRHHVETALQCLRAGRHVLIEKPIAETETELAALKAAARAANLVCMPAHNYIYVPSLQRARRIVEAGNLGQIASAWVIYNIFHPEEIAAIYGGVLREVCVHHAYSLLYLLGRPRRVMAMTSRVHYSQLQCEDQAMIVCEMPGGAIANLWCSFAASDPTSDPWTVVYKILGTKGGISYSWNEAQFEDRGGPGWGLPSYQEGFAGEIDHFINRSILRGEAPLSTLDDAADALRILHASERSSQDQKFETLAYEELA
jgi:predicted dehydrogenase